jgi:hypothetical protein
MADERGDLSPLAQMLEAGAPLPAAVREHLAYMFQDRRLQPKQPTLKTVLRADFTWVESVFPGMFE